MGNVNGTSTKGCCEDSINSCRKKEKTNLEWGLACGKHPLNISLTPPGGLGPRQKGNRERNEKMEQEALGKSRWMGAGVGRGV